MKKLAIGCLIVLVVGGAIVVGVGYYGYMKVKSAVAEFAELGQIGEIERGVRVQTPFTAPASSELTQKQVDQLLQIQKSVHDRLGENMAVFQRNYQALAQKKEATVVDLPTLLSAYKDLAHNWVDAKKAQVAALNEAGLSLAEYRWIRAEAYRALDVPFFSVDFGRLAEQVKAGTPPAEAPIDSVTGGGPSPEANKKLLEPHRKAMEDYLPLAAFGL